MTEEELWFWLCGTRGVYQRDIKKLLSIFGYAQNIFDNIAAVHREELIAEEGAVALINEKKSQSFKRRLEEIKDKGIRFISYASSEYPERLKTIPDVPYCLYVKGQLPREDKPACSIVGARACSAYGKKATQMFSSALAGCGVQIISGMAAGIDKIAAEAAIDAKGVTFAVLGSGIDVIYPKENIELYYEIVNTGGGIISEYPLGTKPIPWQFPHRNRIISGLSDRLLIMEARKRSGTLSTARHALDQGKDIYALPGRITDPLSEGCNALISDGAGILTRPEYIIEEIFSGKSLPNSGNTSEDEFEITENSIYRYLSWEPKSVDEIAARAGLKIDEAAAQLIRLELDGLAEEVSRDFYVRK